MNEHLFQKWTNDISHKPKRSTTQNGQRPSPNQAWLILFVIMYMGRQEILMKVTMDEIIEALETF